MLIPLTIYNIVHYIDYTHLRQLKILMKIAKNVLKVC